MLPFLPDVSEQIFNDYKIVHVCEKQTAEIFHMSDYSVTLKIGNHFYKIDYLVHCEDCPACSPLSE